MTIHPKHIIFPAILAASAALGFTSFFVNKGYASSISPPKDLVETSSETDRAHLSGKFPNEIQRWKDLIESYSDEYGLDPNLIGALILQESGGQSDIISSSGAIGLMQIMPRDGTAAQFLCVNGPCFKNRPTISELSDPNFNILYGTRMLLGLINKTGSLREALKAYGPMDAGYSYADTVLTLKNHFEQ